MTSAWQVDRREFRRYRVQFAAELITHTCEIVPCTVLDISPTGISVSCENISEHIGLKVRLEGFGEIAVARLRAKYRVERLLFRDTEARSQQFVRYMFNLVDAGAASPAIDRRNRNLQKNRHETAGPFASVNDALLRQVDRALNIISQVSFRDSGSIDNVVSFRTKHGSRLREAPPDQPA